MSFQQPCAASVYMPKFRSTPHINGRGYLYGMKCVEKLSFVKLLLVVNVLSVFGLYHRDIPFSSVIAIYERINYINSI